MIFSDIKKWTVSGAYVRNAHPSIIICTVEWERERDQPINQLIDRSYGTIDWSIKKWGQTHAQSVAGTNQFCIASDVCYKLCTCQLNLWINTSLLWYHMYCARERGREREIITIISQLWVFKFNSLLIYLFRSVLFVINCLLGLTHTLTLNPSIYTLSAAEVYAKMTSFYKL